MLIASKMQNARELRVYLRHRNEYYRFSLVKFLNDKSFLIGMSSNKIIFSEYGTAVYYHGQFRDHRQAIITGGNISMEEAKDYHITFHPPRINKQSGIAHIVAPNGKVDEWPLDWFPIRQVQPLIYFTVADLRYFEQVTDIKRPCEIVWIPPNVFSLRMVLCLYPPLTPYKELHDPRALGNVHGLSTDYIVSLKFYQDNTYATFIYIATDTHV